MNIGEMHVWFRQYAQQMGLQNVRAILPEQIDLVINTSISDTVNQLISEHINLTNDRIITDNSKLGQINSLRTLYKVEELTIGTVDSFEYDVVPVVAEEVVGKFKSEHFMDIDIEDDIPITPKVDALYLVDLSIRYNRIYGTQPPKITGFFPVRLIDDAYLADTMQDYVLKPRVRTPIAVLHDNTLDLYLGEDFFKANGKLSSEVLVPHVLRVSYLARPNQVKYLSDVGGDDVDCNLPESMHVDILKHAVDLYNISIQGGLHAAQQQRQAQRQEIARNNARPDNEGYQQ